MMEFSQMEKRWGGEKVTEYSDHDFDLETDFYITWDNSVTFQKDRMNLYN